jgi:hypothetical protein
MELIRKYGVLVIIVLSAVVLVLIRQFGSNHFRVNAKKWAEPSVAQSNIIASDKYQSLPGDKLVINLDKENFKNTGNKLNVLNVPADSILAKKYIRLIRKHKGTVLLFSSEPDISSRVWMVLSQMGIKQLYIITSKKDDELIKYKFRPDSTSRPEF